MFQIMSMPNPVLAASFDLEQLTSDLVASISASPRGALNAALQQALAHTVEAKVNAQLSVLLEGNGDAFYSLDANWRFSYINRAAETYFEDSFALFGLKALAGSHHFDQKPPFFLLNAARDFNVGAFVAVLDGVLKKVHEHLP